MRKISCFIIPVMLQVALWCAPAWATDFQQTYWSKIPYTEEEIAFSRAHGACRPLRSGEPMQLNIRYCDPSSPLIKKAKQHNCSLLTVATSGIVTRLPDLTAKEAEAYKGWILLTGLGSIDIAEVFCE